MRNSSTRLHLHALQKDLFKHHVTEIKYILKHIFSLITFVVTKAAVGSPKELYQEHLIFRRFLDTFR